MNHPKDIKRPDTEWPVILMGSLDKVREVACWTGRHIFVLKISI